MKRNVAQLSILVVLSMILGILAGCGSSTSADESAAAPVSEAEISTEVSPDTEEPVAEEPASAGEPNSSEEPPEEIESGDSFAGMTTAGAGEGAISFPLDETVTFTYWFAPEADGLENLNSFSENLVVQEAEKATNVHLDMTEISFFSQDEQFNLMVAGGDYQDIIQGFGNNYTKGIDNAIEEDIIIDLTDLLPDYAPNYSYIRDNNDDIRKSTTQDSGRVGSFFFLIGDADLGPRQGLWVRQDYLDEQGLDVPTTYDEFHEYLTVTKNAYGLSDSLLMTSTGYFGSMALLGGFDVSASFYNQDGVVKYGPIEDGFREYLEMMHQWYEEGLISSDFATRYETNLMFDATDIIGGKCAAWNANYRQDDSWANSAVEPNFTPLAIADVTKTGSEQIHVGGRGSNVDSYGDVISTACEDPETAVAYIDWWYSDESALLSGYGIEGETYYINDDGQPLYTDMILNNPLGASRNMRNIYTGMSLKFRVPRVVTASYDSGYDRLDRGTWNSNRDNAWDISSFISRTTEEGEDYAAVMSEVETYVEENIPKFIIGDRSLSEWDTYVQDIKNMGIDEAIAIEEACVERYESR